jgi:hypothetical protein
MNSTERPPAGGEISAQNTVYHLAWCLSGLNTSAQRSAKLTSGKGH